MNCNDTNRIEYPSPGWCDGQPLPPMTADRRAVALLGCRPLIGALDGTGSWPEAQIRQRVRCTPLEWFLATVDLQRQGHMTYVLYAALEETTPWRDVALEDIAQGSIDSAGVLWLQERFPWGDTP